MNTGKYIFAQLIEFESQVILDVGVELDGFGPAVAEDGLTDVLFVVGWHGTVAAVVFVVALTVEMVDEMLLQRMSNALGHVVVYLCDTEGHADGLVVAVHGACDTKKSFHINFLINYSFVHISG